MVNKKILGIVAVIAVIIIAVVVVGGGSTVFSSKQVNNTVEAAVTKDCAGTPWFVAQEKGYFKKYGVNFVDKGEIPVAQQSAAFISGEINVYAGHPNSVINLIKSGAKAKAVAVSEAEPTNNDVEKEHMHWLVKSDSPLKTAADFKAFKEQNGRKVKVAIAAQGTCADLETNAWFRKNNITDEYYEFVVLPDPQQEAALQQGSIDIATLHPPFFNKAEHDGGARILFTSTPAFGKAAGTVLIVFSDEYIEKYPDTIRDFLNAFKDGERWANDNREEAGEITAKDIGLPYTSNTHWYSPSGAINDVAKGYIQEWIDAMVIDGQLKEGEITVDQIVTDKFKDTWKTDLPDN
ncbi:ABC transporter substrate-binding protein [Methanobrevibacter curvatus]|uniref:Alkanesulfonate transporter substrate-binding subunit n=1 Tax=Methanobrevibacter curvatus TaxID=49547 RepID=A0A165Z518_9EURY|nr:ABC transporter substrate-binding protein [Methanobrevibacter curvatus]KZX10254.1 alkanesulfonate transporter substrate-binding subunit [Methanobrevibacter curvatus]